MALEVFSEAPSSDQFQPLAEYQASTPATFFGGKPVLHYHSPARLRVTQEDISRSDVLSTLIVVPASSATAPAQNGAAQSGSNSDSVAITIDLWITSANILIWDRGRSGRGLKLNYRSISLHAQQGSELYMQVVLSDMRNTADEDLETVELLLQPLGASEQTNGTGTELGEAERELAAEGLVAGAMSSTGGGEDTRTSPNTAAPDGPTDGVNGDGVNGRAHPHSQIEKLYAAVSACADLHPDPDPDDEAAGGDMSHLLAAAAGDLSGGGWITADNMNEYECELVREDGIAEVGAVEAPLGPGAGTRRTLQEGADDGSAGENGDDDETKWRRTES